MKLRMDSDDLLKAALVLIWPVTGLLIWFLGVGK